MGRSFIFAVLLLLLTTFEASINSQSVDVDSGVASSTSTDGAGTVTGEISNFEGETYREEDELAASTEYNVLDYGAVGDGSTDDSQAFLEAWTAACATAAAYVHAPSDYTFKVYPVTFKGPCLANITMKIDGMLMAPSDPNVWLNASSTVWLDFKRVSVTIQGKGTIDGQGQTWWANSCKTNSNNSCTSGPTALTFDTCTNVTVKYVTIVNSQQMHLAFLKSSGIKVTNVNISAPGDSPNTDGIHLQSSTTVTIENTIIGTGDDCISIQSGSSGITIKNVTCGPGHGISVGGLGKANASATVSDVDVYDIVITDASNGVRIKSWQGSSGTATGFTFENIRMNNVKNPIVIDQYYCDSGSSGSCANFTSNVVISDVTFKNITGTSASKVAVKLSCSETVACKGITLDVIDLVQTGGEAAESSCTNAWGVTADTVIPSSCLQTSS